MKKTITAVAYESPKIDFLLVESEGILCASDLFSVPAGAEHYGFNYGGGIDF